MKPRPRNSGIRKTLHAVPMRARSTRKFPGEPGHFVFQVFAWLRGHTHRAPANSETIPTHSRGYPYRGTTLHVRPTTHANNTESPKGADHPSQLRNNSKAPGRTARRSARQLKHFGTELHSKFSRGRTCKHGTDPAAPLCAHRPVHPHAHPHICPPTQLSNHMHTHPPRHPPSNYAHAFHRTTHPRNAPGHPAT